MTQPIYLPSNELMSESLELRDDYNEFVRKVKVSQQSQADYRIILSNTYLCGRGIEVGAFHAPNYLPEGCTADYADKVDIETLNSFSAMALVQIIERFEKLYFQVKCQSERSRRPLVITQL